MCQCCNKFDPLANNNGRDYKRCKEKFYRHLPHEWFEVQGQESFWAMDEKITQSVGQLRYCDGYREEYSRA